MPWAATVKHVMLALRGFPMPGIEVVPGVELVAPVTSPCDISVGYVVDTVLPPIILLHVSGLAYWPLRPCFHFDDTKLARSEAENCRFSGRYGHMKTTVF